MKRAFLLILTAVGLLANGAFAQFLGGVSDGFNNDTGPSLAISVGLDLDDSPLAYSEGDGATAIDAAGMAAAFGNDFDGATLTAAISSGAVADDRLSIIVGGSPAIAIGSGVISVDGVDVGTVSPTGGEVSASGTLTLTFNSAATRIRVEAVLAAIGYRSTAAFLPASSTRTVSMTLTALNGAMAGDSRTIHVSDPQLEMFAGGSGDGFDWDVAAAQSIEAVVALTGVPALTEWGLAVLVLALAGVACARLKRARAAA